MGKGQIQKKTSHTVERVSPFSAGDHKARLYSKYKHKITCFGCIKETSPDVSFTCPKLMYNEGVYVYVYLPINRTIDNSK